MKLEELFESDDTQKTIDLINNGFRENFLHMIDNRDKELWRGFSLNTEHTAKKMMPMYDRHSLTGFSFMNTYQSNNRAWADFPKRNRSIFCTTSYDTAYEFGHPVLIIPADSVDKIATAPQDWNDITIDRAQIVSEVSMYFNDLANIIKNVVNTYDVLEDYIDLDSISAMNSTTNSYVNIMKFCKSVDALVDFIEDELDEYNEREPQMVKQLRALYKNIRQMFGQMTVLNWLDKNIIPEKMECYSYDSYKSAEFFNTDSNEIWFSGEYLILQWPKLFRTLPRYQEIITQVLKR